jgi:small subunit ribosomal protein S17
MAVKNNRKQLTGVVSSDKTEKTVTVSVTRQEKHPLYKKYIRKTTKLLVHDEKNECKLGDEVSIKEVRPISKRKRWMVVQVLRKAQQETIALKEEGSEA